MKLPLVLLPLLLLAALGTVDAFVAPSSATRSNNPLLLQLQATKDPDAKEDGGPEPTDEEWKELLTMASNVRYKNKMRTSAMEHAKSIIPANLRYKGIVGFWRVSPNLALFKILQGLRTGTDTYACDLREVNFSNKISDTLFYQTKDDLVKEAQLAVFYPVLKLAPPLRPEEGYLDYAALFDGKVEPYEAMMISEDPEDCFIKNAPAFCRPETTNPSRAVCDLDYLAGYNVDKDTPDGLRYGGRAVVQGGKIVEISGVKPEEDQQLFDKKKYIFLSSFAVHLVVAKHAVMAHLAIYQRLLIKLTTHRNARYTDGWKNSLGPYRFLQGLLSRTNEVSLNEQLLIGPGNSLVARATSLTNLSLLKLGKDYYKKYAEMTPQEVIESNASEGSAEWNKACNKVFEEAQKAVRKICKELIDKEVITDADVDDLALLVWASTFYHFFIGDFQLDNVIKGNLPFKLTGKKHEQTYPYGTLSTTIGVTTMTRTADMKTLASYLPDEEHRTAWLDYEKILKSVKLGIAEYDKNQNPIYNSINF